jgi:hypothetical protein
VSPQEPAHTFLHPSLQQPPFFSLRCISLASSALAAATSLLQPSLQQPPIFSLGCISLLFSALAASNLHLFSLRYLKPRAK